MQNEWSLAWVGLGVTGHRPPNMVSDDCHEVVCASLKPDTGDNWSAATALRCKMLP